MGKQKKVMDRSELEYHEIFFSHQKISYLHSDRNTS